ncbi:hypothetical protein MKZ26_03245 [Sporosarcina sp. FSL K6-6792]|uniref:hypothetical protein n=1 Tax=Sporosarcina sp. FSL K6-6792 TaxID=2921559 RepID=UPI0030FB5112
MNIRNIMAKATAAVEFMYDKTATIERFEEYVKPNGADGTRWVTVHADLPCRLSSSTLNNALQGDANVIQYDVKLFLSSGFKVLAGDVVTVDGMKYESAKEPFVYVSHQEVLLIRKGYA